MSDALLNIGPATLGGVLFILLACWSFGHRRVDKSLAALGLYLGLLDGYLKLRSGSNLVTLARDLLVIAIAGGALVRAMHRHESLSLPPLGGFVIAFAAVVFVEIFNPHSQGIANGLAGVRQHLEFVPLFFLGYAFVRSERQVQKLLLLLVVCAAVGGVVSYVQSRLTPEQFAAWGPGYRDRVLGLGTFTGAGRVAVDSAGNAVVRPFGLGSDSGAGAAAAALALPALIALIMTTSGRLLLAMVPLAAGIALAVASSGSRAALVTVFVSAVAFGCLAATSRNATRVTVGLAVGALFIYGAFAYLGPQSSTTRRAKTIAPGSVLTTFAQERGAGFTKFGDYLFAYPLGIGVGAVGPAAVALSAAGAPASQFNSETQWNYLLLETGLAGLAIFVGLCIRLIALSLTRIRHVPDAGLRLNLAALAGPIFGIVVAGFAGPVTASTPTGPYLWLVAGVLSYWLVSRYRHGPVGASS